jgi:16S rRNA (uracil1498-N3)-methyltransferase
LLQDAFMREVRIYSSTPLTANAVIELPAEAARHVGQVLRMKPGQALVLFDGNGGSYAATIRDVSNRSLCIETGVHQTAERESPMHLTLWHGLCRGERMDSVVQKATELGANSIRPLLTERSMVKLDERRAKKKLDHWRKTAVSACEQCGRNQLPELEVPARLKDALDAIAEFDLALLLDPRSAIGLATALTGHSEAKKVLICTGPEGGFTAEEVEMAQQAGMLPVHAGPRVLRTETAPLVAISMVQTLLGDLRGDAGIDLSGSA